MRQFITIIICAMTVALPSVAYAQMKHRGVVYDVGLQYSPGSYSRDTFDIDQVRFDMGVISGALNANAVRIEGESIYRLCEASRAAHRCGLKVLLNPWLIGGNEEQTISYMRKAAKSAETLRREGIDIVFVAGCEYSLFNHGVIEGATIYDRIEALTAMTEMPQYEEQTESADKRLNRILSNIASAVKEEFHGSITYSAGVWENVDWDIFDIVGIDYYRDSQTQQEYVAGINRYLAYGKPVYVMEVGCCAFEGADTLGAGGFLICQGSTPDGKTGVYADGLTPVRSERVQADYIDEQIGLLYDSGIHGMFVFEFSLPALPYRQNGFDADMTSYSLVKTFAPELSQSRVFPYWSPKEAFYTVSRSYGNLRSQELNYPIPN